MINAGSIIASLDLDTGKFSTKLKEAQDSVDGFSGKLKGYGKASEELGKGLTLGLTMPIVGIGTAATNMALSFEAGMSRVQAISGATDEQLGQLSEQALQLGADTAFSASEVAAGMENLASAGYETNAIMAAMPGLLDLAAVSGGNVGLASEIAASAINGFGLEASEAGHIADVFARAAADTNAEVADMGEAMKYIAPVANAMGMSIEETAAAVGILSDAGIKGGQAGTVLRGALTRLVKPTEKMETVMEELGLSFFDTEGNMMSLEGIVGQLQSATSGLTQEQKNNAMATLFGQEALSGMLVLTEQGPEKLNELTNGLKNSEGAAKEMAEVILDNGKGSIEEMMGALETAGIKIGKVIIPVITDLANAVGKAADWFSNLDEGTQETIIKMAALAAAVGPVLIIGGKLASGLGSIAGLFKLFSGASAVASGATAALGTAGTVASGGLAALAGAALPWVAGAAAVVVAGKEVYDHLNEELIPEFELFDETISETTKEALGSFMELSDEATNQLSYLGMSGARISEQMYIDLTANTNQMCDEITARMQKQKEDGLRILTEQLDKQVDLSEEEKEEMLRIATEKYDAEITKVSEGKARVEEIMRAAKEANRSITEEEKNEIESILESLKDDSISLMTESKEEQENILNKLKENSERITVEMMSEVIKNSIEQKEKTVENANKQYEETLAAAELLKRDGTAESIELADNMISEAERQREEVVKEAEEMHKKVLEELEKQGGDLIKQIDTDNGNIKTEWSKLKDWFANNPIVRFFKSIDEDGSGAKAERNDRVNPLGMNALGTNSWRGGLTWVGEQGPELVDLPKGSKIHSNDASMQMMEQEVRHSGTIRIEGVSNDDIFYKAVEAVMDNLRREIRS